MLRLLSFSAALALLVGMTAPGQAQNRITGQPNIFGGQNYSDGTMTKKNIFGGYDVYQNGRRVDSSHKNIFGGQSYNSGLTTKQNVFGGQTYYRPGQAPVTGMPNVFGGQSYGGGNYSKKNIFGGTDYFGRTPWQPTQPKR
ncbi:MAG: hypothetical protein LC104_08265 [Bacteroidales bacterium]|nr:hypothetical protein [Bacteroidales bacterium]